MVNTILIIIGAILTILWGSIHLFPTSNVVKGYGDISQDNKRIITMEWINEGLTLMFIGALNSLIAIFVPINLASSIVYWTSSAMLFIMAILSLMTGARINFIPYRLCPVIFTGSGLLILIGSFI